MKHRTPESFQDATQFERRLIDAGREDQVPAALQQRMAQAFATSANLPPIAATHGASQAAHTGLGSAAGTRGMLFSPAGLWGTLSAAVLIGFVSWQVTSNPRPRPARDSEHDTSHAATATHVESPSSEQATLAASVAQQPSAASAAVPAQRPAAPAMAQASRLSGPSSAGNLREELALLDGARTALAARDSARALRLLDQHAQRWRRGRLTPEADALRIEAQVQRGDTARAERLSRRFLERHPSHPLAEHIANISNANIKRDPEAPQR